MAKLHITALPRAPAIKDLRSPFVYCEETNPCAAAANAVADAIKPAAAEMVPLPQKITAQPTAMVNNIAAAAVAG